VLEFLAMYQDLDPDPEFDSKVYRFTHVANSPNCLQNHPEWLVDFERVEAGVLEAGAPPKPAASESLA
jgi:hypothetical protein